MPTAIGFCRTTTQQRNTLPCQLTRGRAMSRTQTITWFQVDMNLALHRGRGSQTTLASCRVYLLGNLGQWTRRGSEEIFFTHLRNYILQAFNKSYGFLCVFFFGSLCLQASRCWRGATDKISTAAPRLISLLDTHRGNQTRDVGLERTSSITGRNRARARGGLLHGSMISNAF